MSLSKQSDALCLRLADLADLEAINGIYNHYVEHSVSTFDMEGHSPEKRLQWFEEHRVYDLPILVASDNGKIIAWASASRYSGRCGYKHTVELSMYVASDYLNKGIGRQLMKSLVGECQEKGYHAMLAIVAADNDAGIALLRSFGFEIAGRLKEVGYKFGRWLDVTIMQKVVEQ